MACSIQAQPAGGLRSSFLHSGAITIMIWLMCAGLALGQETQDAIEGEPEDNNAQVMIAEPDGSQMKMLTLMKDYLFQGSSEWSRDGKVVAFDCRERGRMDIADSVIAVVNADGTNPRRLGDGVMPSLSPRGNRIAYSRIGKGVWVQTVAEPIGPPMLLDPEGWGTAWSPDGTRIAYGLPSPVNLVIHDLVEENRSLLFTAANNPYRSIQWNFCWSPDSKQIAFTGSLRSGANVLSIVDARGAEFGHTIRLEANILPGLTWSPDGTRILYSAKCPERAGLRQIYELNPQTMDPPTLLPRQATNRQMEDMSFSPDGKKLTLTVHPPVKK